MIGLGCLTEVHRNAGLIVHACAAIRAGRDFTTTDRVDLDATPPLNLRMVECRTETQQLDALDKILGKGIVAGRFDATWQTQVITPRNKQSKVSRTVINDRLQRLLNPNGVTVPGNPFRVGDKIICLRNGWNGVVEHADRRTASEEAKNYSPYIIPYDEEPLAGVQGEPGQAAELYVANGEIGRVVAVGASLTVARFSEGEAAIKIPMGKAKPDKVGVNGEATDGEENGGSESEERSERGRGCNFDLGFALTYHKSQGAEWPCVILMIDESAGMLACRELIYTGISRGSKLTICIGKESVLKQHAKRASLIRRKTFLGALLKEAELQREFEGI